MASGARIGRGARVAAGSVIGHDAVVGGGRGARAGQPGRRFGPNHPVGKHVFAATAVPGNPSDEQGRSFRRCVLLLGSYPPRECGIATFMHDVKTSFDGAFSTRTEVIAIDEPGGEARRYPPAVVARLQRAGPLRLPLDGALHRQSSGRLPQHSARVRPLRRRARRMADRSARSRHETGRAYDAHRAARARRRDVARYARTLRALARASFRSRQPAAICSSASTASIRNVCA